MTWADVREQIVDTLDLVADVTVERFTPGQINPPCLFPGSPTFTPATQDGGRRAEMTWHVAMQNTTEAWQSILEELVHGVGGILDVIEAHAQLRGASWTWTEVDGFGELEFAGTTYLGARVTVEVEF